MPKPDKTEWQMLPGWIRWTVGLLFLLELTIILAALPGKYTHRPLIPVQMSLVLGGAVAVPLAGFALLAVSQMDRLGRRFRAGQCLWCGYDLRATTENRCPECGKAKATISNGCDPRN